MRSQSLAPEIEFTTYDGETIRLSDLRGQGVVLNFWASWCGPCRAEAPLLVEAWEQDARTVSSSSASPTQTLTKARGTSSNSTACDYPNGPDEGLTWARRYDVQGIPATFFIDEDGILVSQHRGMIVQRRRSWPSSWTRSGRGGKE